MVLQLFSKFFLTCYRFSQKRISDSFFEDKDCGLLDNLRKK